MDDDYPKNSYNDRQLLYRIDERTNLLVTGMAAFKEEIHQLTQSLDQKYVSKEEFQPVKLLVYGLVGLIMCSVIGSLLVLVVKGS